MDVRDSLRVARRAVRVFGGNFPYVRKACRHGAVVRQSTRADRYSAYTWSGALAATGAESVEQTHEWLIRSLEARARTAPLYDQLRRRQR
jgi:hypothetical protein